LNAYSSYRDEQLLLLLKNGDESSFTELYQRYWRKLFGLAVYKLKNPSDAEEILQDIFLDIWRRRQNLNIQSNFSSYLSAALSYRVINYFARRHPGHQPPVSDSSAPADHSTPEQLRAMELNEHIQQLVGQLPEKCQLVFRLSREEQLSNREIAEHIQISEKTVESHISRALRLLRAGIGLLLALLIDTR
jgi:RNA polymerase sigma-70 factor (ECF subfamily)